MTWFLVVVRPASTSQEYRLMIDVSSIHHLFATVDGYSGVQITKLRACCVERGDLGESTFRKTNQYIK